MSADLESRVRSANPVHDDQLEQLFGADASTRLLRDIRDRRVAPMRTSDDQDFRFETPTPTGSPWWRRGWIAALSAAAVVILIIGVVALVQSGDDRPVGSEAPGTTIAPATSQATATTAPEAVAPVDPIAVVMSSIDAYNAGDMDAWLAHFSEDAAIAGFRIPDAAAAFAPVFAANAVRTTAEPCHVVETGADGSTTVECDHVEVNDFNGPAGFVHPDTAAYIVGPDGLILFYSAANSVDYRAVTRYETLFWLWLEEAHPNVFARIESELTESGDNPPGTGGKFPETVADMELALQYVDEFVAQSDDYPIDTAGEEALGVVTSSIDAYNAGDMEAWLAHFTEDAAILGWRQETAPAWFAPLFAANSRFELEEPCRLTESTTEGERVVVCVYVETDDVLAAAAVAPVYTTAFIVDENGTIRSASAPAIDEFRPFLALYADFYRWLEVAHPDVYAQVELSPGAPGTGDSSGRPPETVEAMELMLQYIDEFVEQSDVYPLSAAVDE